LGMRCLAAVVVCALVLSVAAAPTVDVDQVIPDDAKDLCTRASADFYQLDKSTYEGGDAPKSVTVKEGQGINEEYFKDARTIAASSDGKRYSVKASATVKAFAFIEKKDVNGKNFFHIMLVCAGADAPAGSFKAIMKKIEADCKAGNVLGACSGIVLDSLAPPMPIYYHLGYRFAKDDGACTHYTNPDWNDVFKAEMDKLKDLGKTRNTLPSDYLMTRLTRGSQLNKKATKMTRSDVRSKGDAGNGFKMYLCKADFPAFTAVRRRLAHIIHNAAELEEMMN